MMAWPGILVNLLLCVIALAVLPSSSADEVYDIKVQTDLSNRTYVQRDFLSVAAWLRKEIVRYIDFSPKLHNLAAALAPATVRIGGTRSNLLTFDPNENHPAPSNEEPYLPLNYLYKRRLQRRTPFLNFTFTGQMWSKVTNFTQSVGWEVMFDFNALFKRKNGRWDPSNAEQFLSYSDRKGINITAFELGNEPDSNFHIFGKKYNGTTSASDYLLLKQTLEKFPRYRNSKLVGPEVTQIHQRGRAFNFVNQLLSAGGYKVLDALSMHHYYLNGKTATAEQFLDPNVLDKFAGVLGNAMGLISRYDPTLPLVLTETDGCVGGGAPGLSNRFIDGFLWLDKLGVAAQKGVQTVYRQTFNMGAYALISPKGHNPYPDYYISLLFKRLVLGPVLSASVEPQTTQLRTYAHCARTDYYSYPKGAVVLYFLNLQNTSMTLSLSEYAGKTLDLYMLTPGDSKGLTSGLMKLNGETLLMQGDNLPPLTAKRHRGDVQAEPQSYGYIVVLDADVKECFSLTP